MSSVDGATFSIRAGSAADYAALLEIDDYARSHPERAASLRTSLEHGECSVALLGEKIVGFAVLTYGFFGFGFIPLIVVAAAHRRRGVALRLLSQVETRCRTAKLFASANASNTAAQTLFRQAGFVHSGTIDNLDEGDPEIIFFKSLPLGTPSSR